MKKSVIIFCFLIIATMLLTAVCFGQYTKDNIAYEKHVRGVILKTNPLSILWSPVFLTAEYRVVAEVPVAAQQSVMVGLSYLGRGWMMRLAEFGSSTPPLSLSGYRFQIGYKFYFLELDAKYRFYLSPHFSYAFANLKEKNSVSQDYIKFTNINGNLLFGYQTPIFFQDRMDLDIFFGFGYRSNKMANYNSSISNIPTEEEDGLVAYDGPLKIVLGFNIGFEIK